MKNKTNTSICNKLLYLILSSFLLPLLIQANSWNIGPSRTYTKPSQITNLVQDGDTVFIDGGIYYNDAVKWPKKNLSIIGLGDSTNRTIMRYSGDIPNGKGIFVFETPGNNDNAYIENIDFDSAQISMSNGGNGAGIRFQAVNLTVNKCRFSNCQNGILEGNGSVTTSNVIITNCEFRNNGFQVPNNVTFSGYEHHIYIGASADTLMVINNYFHHPRGQANSIKTRAQRSFILYNLIDEEATGFGSWEINIAQGGLNIIMGNIIIQGQAGINHGIVGYDDTINAIKDFYFVNNTVINKYNGIINYFNVVPNSGINTFKVYNNIFASIPTAVNNFFSGNKPAILDTASNLFLTDYTAFGFKNVSANNFNLTSTAIAAIEKGKNLTSTNTGFSLTPLYMYNRFDKDLIPRYVLDTVDIGAYEYMKTITPHIKTTYDQYYQLYPNPTLGFINIQTTSQNISTCTIDIYSANGQLMFTEKNIHPGNTTGIDLSQLPSGTYCYTIHDENGVHSGNLIIQ